MKDPQSGFVPHFELDEPPGEARGWVLFLHGIYGSAANWQSFARKFVEREAGLGAVRVDLRMHGNSLTAPGPHTLENAARDLLRLEGVLPGPVVGVSGHSFGGKVALEYARLRPQPLERLWVLDSDPAEQARRRQGEPGGEDTVLKVLGLLGELPHFSTRRDFLHHMEQQGIARSVAQWLGKNLVATDGGVRFSLDPTALRALLDDYFLRDLLTVVSEETLADRIDFVLGEKSSAVSPGTIEELSALTDNYFRVHWIAGAGHWLHVDAPGALLELLSPTPQE